MPNQIEDGNESIMQWQIDGYQKYKGRDLTEEIVGTDFKIRKYGDDSQKVGTSYYLISSEKTETTQDINNSLYEGAKHFSYNVLPRLLKTKSIDLDHQSSYSWLETFKNAISSNRLCNNHNHPLVIKYEKSEESLKIKIKDSGIGFTKTSSEKYFSYKEIDRSTTWLKKTQTKKNNVPPSELFGGAGVGVNLFVGNVEGKGGIVHLKNRKSCGATVEVKFR